MYSSKYCTPDASYLYVAFCMCAAPSHPAIASYYSKSHAMTKTELRAMNNLKENAALVTGQILQVFRKKRRSHSMPALSDPLEPDGRVHKPSNKYVSRSFWARWSGWRAL